MLDLNLNITLLKYSFGLRARLRMIFDKSSSLTSGVLRPANFIPDYIEVKQKVGGNPLRLSMLHLPLIYNFKFSLCPSLTTSNWTVIS